MSGMCKEFTNQEHIFIDIQSYNSIGGINFVFERIYFKNVLYEKRFLHTRRLQCCNSSAGI